MISILIAEDHPVVLSGLQTLLGPQEGIDIVAIAKTGKETLELLEKHSHTQVVVMDIKMPEIDGIKATQLIKEKFPHIGVLILTVYKNIQFILNAQEAGANGYLLKNADKIELLHAIKEIAKGEMYFGQEILMEEKKYYQQQKHQGPIIQFTQREIEVLRWMAEDLTAKEIAVKMNIANSTVLTYQKHLKQKIQAKSEKGVVRYAVENGYVDDNQQS